MTLFAHTASAAESTHTVSDADGLFSLALPAMGTDSVTMALRVQPRGKPGYTLSPLECRPVGGWGDACVLNPIVEEPSFPIYQFVYRNDRSRVVANTRVSFKRTSGAGFFGPKAKDLIELTTDPAGFAFLFPPGIYATGVDPVVGDLTVELPLPIGTTVRHGYLIPPNPRFNARLFAIQETGPTINYRMFFADSLAGLPLSGVEVRFRRLSGIATSADTFRVVSNKEGVASFVMAPLAQGTITGDFTISRPGSPVVTSIKGVSLTTFDADSSIELSRWKVGATGTLYLLPPAAP
jgi:hypothetical protein